MKIVYTILSTFMTYTPYNIYKVLKTFKELSDISRRTWNGATQLQRTAA